MFLELKYKNISGEEFYDLNEHKNKFKYTNENTYFFTFHIAPSGAIYSNIFL